MQPHPATATINGDPVRLKSALASVVAALRRELVSSDRLLIRMTHREFDGRKVAWVAIADADRIEALSTADRDSLVTFDEWRGGCGLTLPVARRTINVHGGQIWSPKDDSKAGAALAFPLT